MEDKELKKLRKKFVKDEKLPIPIFEEKYFNYYLELYDNIFNTKEKYRNYLEIIKKYGWEGYYQKYNDFKDTVIDHVKSKESFKKFNEKDLNRFGVRDRQVKSSNRQFFIVENTNKKWISIDLTKANFSVLKYMDKDIVDGKDTYEEWVSQFDGHEIFGNLKSVRQIIFGNLNPKRHQTIQAFVLNEIMNKVNTYEDDLFFWIMGADEFIIEYTDSLNNKLDIELKNLENEFGFKLKKKVFELNKNGDLPEFGFIKKDEDGKVELIGVNKHFFAQAYKYYINEEIHPYDLLFYHENRVATFLEGLK